MSISGREVRDDSVISTREAAKRLGVSVRTAQLWVEAGVLRAWKTAGNHRRIYSSSVERLIRERAREITTVLVVEDDPITQAYYESLFAQVQPAVSVDFANNGYEGLMKAGAERPALLMVDVVMPEMDGLQMIRSIRAALTAAGSQIAVVTSLSPPELAARGGVPAGIPFYPKPLSLAALGEILARLPGDHRVFGAPSSVAALESF